MKISKKTLKIIFIIFMIGILTSGISVYATYRYLAKDVSYVKSNGEELNVEEALNELYSKNTTDIEYKIFASNVINTSSAGIFYTTTISIPKGKTRIYMYSSAKSTYNINSNPIIKSTIIKENSVKVYDATISGVIHGPSFINIIETNGDEGDITIQYSAGGRGSHFVGGIVFYK